MRIQLERFKSNGYLKNITIIARGNIENSSQDKELIDGFVPHLSLKSFLIREEVLNYLQFLYASNFMLDMQRSILPYPYPEVP